MHRTLALLHCHWKLAWQLAARGSLAVPDCLALVMLHSSATVCVSHEQSLHCLCRELWGPGGSHCSPGVLRRVRAQIISPGAAAPSVSCWELLHCTDPPRS